MITGALAVFLAAHLLKMRDGQETQSSSRCEMVKSGVTRISGASTEFENVDEGVCNGSYLAHP